jgi:hypothetical protein
MEELFPIIGGVLLGCGLGYLNPRIRWRIGLPIALLLGVLATVFSGEFRLTWAYLLIDIPLVVGCAGAALFVVHRVRWGDSAPQ